MGRPGLGSVSFVTASLRRPPSGGPPNQGNPPDSLTEINARCPGPLAPPRGPPQAEIDDSRQQDEENRDRKPVHCFRLTSLDVRSHDLTAVPHALPFGRDRGAAPYRRTYALDGGPGSYNDHPMEVLPYDRVHLDRVVALAAAERWASYSEDPERAHRSLTAPGVTAVVALIEEEVVGIAVLQSDGEIQAHLSLLVVAPSHRGAGLGRRLLGEGFMRAGGQRVDLVTDSAGPFYESLAHKRLSGYRIYPEVG